MRLGRRDEALAAARRAAELLPDWPGAHNNLATVYAMARRYDDALRAYETSVALAPTNPLTLLGLAYLHVHTGRAARGVEYAEQVHAALGENDRAFELLDRPWRCATPVPWDSAPMRAFDVLRNDRRMHVLRRRVGLR